MRENLHRFFRAARGAGVRVSPAESIDAMRAVAKTGISDRIILRDPFLLTLAKTQDEKRALGECFDLFFDQPEPAQTEQRAENDNQPDAPESSEPAASGQPAAGMPGGQPNPGQPAEGQPTQGQPTEGLGSLARM